jgi:hypothetical protein
MVDQLIDRIYECAFVPELWPKVLDELGKIAGARGGVLSAANNQVVNWTASPSLKHDFDIYAQEGWGRVESGMIDYSG